MAKGQKTNLNITYVPSEGVAGPVLFSSAKNVIDPAELREALRVENDFAEQLGTSMIRQMSSRLLDYLIARTKSFNSINIPMIIWNFLTERSVRVAYERGYKDAMSVLLRRHVAIQQQLEGSYPDYDKITEDETDPEKSRFANEVLKKIQEVNNTEKVL